MFHQFVDYLQVIIVHYGALGVFIATFIEEAIAPIPSAAILFAASLALFEGMPFSLNLLVQMFFILILPGAIGMTLGSLVYYFAAYYLGKPAIERYGSYVGLKWSSIEALQSYFKSGYSDEIIMITLRSLPIVSSMLLSIFAGVIRYNFITYLWTTFVGNLIHVAIIGMLAWYLGQIYLKIAPHLDAIGLVIVGIVVGAGLAYYYYRKLFSR